MERGVKRRPRRRLPIPFLLLAVAVVGCAFAAAVAVVVPMDADSPGGQDQALPAPTLEKAERDKLDAPTAATPTPTPAPYIPDEAEVEMLARLIWGEARGIPSDMHKAAVVWCVLNRVDAEGWPDTVAEVVTQPHQFAGYSPDYCTQAAIDKSNYGSDPTTSQAWYWRLRTPYSGNSYYVRYQVRRPLL